MAYLNFSPIQGESVAAPANRSSTPASAFSALEWQVVALARKDRLSSLRTPSRVGAALGVVFGSRRANPRLADPALEALRRTAVLAWHRGDAIPARDISAFHDAGYTTNQYDALIASISRATQSRG